MIERKCVYCKYHDAFLCNKPCKDCFCKATDSSRMQLNFELDPIRYFKSEMRRLADKYKLTVRFPEDGRAEFKSQHIRFYASINTEWTESSLEDMIKFVEEQIENRVSEAKNKKENEMIPKFCRYCKHVNTSPDVKPCSICVGRFGDDKPNFELDPIRYFKNMMGSLAKEFGVNVEFYTRRSKDCIYASATFSYEGSKSKYSIEVNNGINESNLMDCIESVRRKLPTLKNPEPVPTFDLSKKPNYTFGIKQAMRESSFGRVRFADNRCIPKIKDVKFNGPATIVFWEDGTKTVVKCQEGDRFNSEKGLAMAIAKKALGNEVGYYSENIEPWVEKYRKEKRNNLVKELDEATKYFKEMMKKTTFSSRR